MSERANFFKIGLFVIGATTIVVVGIVVLGANVLFRHPIVMESYFDETVQGLDVGSPVKFRGVQIGRVETITLAGNEYPTAKRYVLVRFALERNAFQLQAEHMNTQLLQREIDKGLRVRTAAKGVTGTAFLEADYLDPQRHPTLAIDWAPDYPYVPSAGSVITQLSDSVNRILFALEKIDLERLIINMEESLQAIAGLARDTNMKEISRQTELLLTEIRRTNNNLDQMVQGVSAELPASLANLRQTLHRLDSLLVSQQPNVEETLDNLRVLSDNLRTLSDEARAYPAHTLFGAPPAPAFPGETP